MATQQNAKANEIRRRKGKDQQNGKPILRKRQKSTQKQGIQQSLICLIICAVLFIGLIVLYTDHIPWHVGHKIVDHVGKTFGYHNPVHAVVIDAGSTGSRVLAFTFHKSLLKNELMLDKELFVYTKPGLSAFANNPDKAVASLSTLIEKAKIEIPEEYWNKTPIILRATAGLRLLPSEKAEALITAVRKYFSILPFLTDDKSVEILDGTDEGIFSWFTVNFLKNRVQSPVTTVAALDLGGGSTQVTFSALTPTTLKQKEFIHEAVLPNQKTPVYTNSYLGLGLMAARKEILTFNQENDKKIISECVNPIIKETKFHYGGVDYFVSGLQENYPTLKTTTSDIRVSEVIPIVDYEKCSSMVKNYVLSKAKPPEELPNKTIFAFSYYFDRATECGIINENTGGSIAVKAFKNHAEKVVCKEANADQPFMCLDLIFISSLLEDGFGLDENTEINLYKKINGHEISWALGAAFNMLKGNN